MKTFRDYNPDQQLLLPPDMQDWLPQNHLARFISDLVEELDLSAIYSAYRSRDGRGQPPYHPAMMVKLLLYAYCVGLPSSRKVEQATYTDLAFRVLACDQHPDHASIAEFRRRHLHSLSLLFAQVLRLCEKAGLVKLGHVAIDGTKIKANASKHKAMSYERMCQAEKKLEEEIAALLAQAEAVDAAEDETYGPGGHADEMPQELSRRESRLKVIREAKQALEEDARARAIEQAQKVQLRLQERERQEQETGKKIGGRKPTVPDPEKVSPDGKAQRNFTDPESRIMADGATKSFEQAYNSQAAVDGCSQIIVAAEVTQEANDKRELAPMGTKVMENTGRVPVQISADSGYFSEEAVTDEALKDVELYVAVDRQKHGEALEVVDGEALEVVEGETPVESSIKEQMEHKLKTSAGKAAYALRKGIVEPVFGQIKQARGFRRFLMRGLEKVRNEWKLICLTHNLLKLFGSLCSSRSRNRALALTHGVVALQTA